MHRSNRPSALSFLLTVAALGSVATAAHPQPDPAGTESPAPIVQPSLTVTGELWHNTSGGLATGSRWNALADLSLEVGLTRLGAPAGASLTAQLLWIENQHSGPDFGDLTGAANPASGLNAGDAWRVFNLFYRQSWCDDRYALKLGQLALDDDFMGSDYAGLFAFSALGAMPSQVATGHSGNTGGCAYPLFAVAAPGAHFAATVNDTFSFQLGLYHGGPGPDERANHGFDWGDGSGQGLVLFYEGAYCFSLGGRSSTVRAGGAFHSGRFDDFAALADGTEDAAMLRGLHSFYLIQDLVLLARDADHPTLAAFWRAGLSPQQDRSAVRRYADAGLNWFAPLPGRADDIAGLAFSYTEYGDAYRRLDPALAAAETALELTYRAQLTEHLALQGIVQRHFNPLPADDASRHAATVFALRAELTF